jgi:hypothetical protein
MLPSALALAPFFYEIASLASGAPPSLKLQEELSACGRLAEIAMYQATGGANSQRGAIWCLGLLVAAAAMHDHRTQHKFVYALVCRALLSNGRQYWRLIFSLLSGSGFNRDK